MSEPEERQSWPVGMTERRRRMLTFINAYMAAEGVFPTIREMGAAIDVSSTSLVAYNLNRLIDAGAIDGAIIRTNKPRARADLSVALKYFGGCAYCGSEDVEMQREHFIPFSRGGDDTAENIVPACMACNKKKGNKDPIKWVTTHFGKDTLAIILYYLELRSLATEKLKNGGGDGSAAKNTGFSVGKRNRTPQGVGEMTVIEAARHFGVTSHTIMRWIKRGYLAGKKRGPGRTSGWLVPESEVRRLEAQLAGTTSQEAGHAEEAQTE